MDWLHVFVFFLAFQGTSCYIPPMPELLEQPTVEFATLPIVLSGELTDNFTSPNLLEETPSSETESPAALVVAKTIAATEAVDHL